MEFKKAALCALYIRTSPPRADACPPAAANDGGIVSVTGPRGSMDRNDPGSCSGVASGSPKFEVLPTRMRAGSSTCPGCVSAANAGLSWIGPPAKNVPTGLIADAPGIPTATTRPSNDGALSSSSALPMPRTPIVMIATAAMTATKMLRPLPLVMEASLHSRKRKIATEWRTLLAAAAGMLLWIGHEPVPHSAERLKVASAGRVVFQVATEADDEVVDRSCF